MSHDAATQRLRVAGPLTLAERDALLSASADGPYTAAVTALAEAPRRFVAERMQAFDLPRFTTPLAELPAGVVLPSAMRGRIYHDATAGLLGSVGPLLDAERTQLLSLSDNATYQAAVEALFVAPSSYVPAQENRFLGPADAAALFDNSTTEAQRFRHVLDQLLPFLRERLSSNLVTQKLADALELETAVAGRLLAQDLDSPTEPDRRLLTNSSSPRSVRAGRPHRPATPSPARSPPSGGFTRRRCWYADWGSTGTSCLGSKGAST